MSAWDEPRRNEAAGSHANGSAQKPSTLMSAEEDDERDIEQGASHRDDRRLGRDSRSANTKTKVVIVGAGIAGLAAAQKLVSGPCSEQFDVTLLEAQSRVGGRICTQFLDEGFIELGAQWVHGEEGNPLFEFAHQRNLLSDPKRDYGIEGEGHFCTESGEVLDNAEVEEAIMAMDRIKEHLAEGHQDLVGRSAEEVFRAAFQKYVDKNLMTKPDILWAVFNWYMLFENIDNACDDLTKLSPRAYSDWIDCPGVPLINFRDGYHSLIESILDELPQNTLRLDTPVVKIDSSVGKQFVEVTTASHEVIQAHHVIITASLGVLQETMSTLFEPPLPFPKSQMIQSMGFGTINKIYLEFEERFWTAHDFGYQLVWRNRRKNCEQSNQFPAWTYYLSGFDVVRGQRNMLVGWVGGKGARQVESESEADIGRTCSKLLRTFLNNNSLPEPIKVICSKWYSNQWTRGSYSHRSTDCEKLDLPFEVLSDPIVKTIKDEPTPWPCVLFSGEATDKEFYSSTHGGLRSGWREADRLINFWKSRVDNVN